MKQLFKLEEIRGKKVDRAALYGDSYSERLCLVFNDDTFFIVESQTPWEGDSELNFDPDINVGDVNKENYIYGFCSEEAWAAKQAEKRASELRWKEERERKELERLKQKYNEV